MLALVAPLILSTTYAVSGAELYTTQSWRYGRFEARVRFAPGDGIVSTFFLWKLDSEMPDVYWNEVDIEKIGPECTYSSNVFWGLPEMQMSEEIETGVDLCGEWHTHAIEWTPQAIVWTLDGEEVRRVEGEVAAGFEANAPQGVQFRFNLWVGTEAFGGAFSEDSLPAYQFIDWVAYSDYVPRGGDSGSDFALQWREDFLTDELPSEWVTGNWESPLGQSIHAPENVVVVDGVAVLALTADDALGFDGTPPDPGDPPEEGDTTGASESEGGPGSEGADAGGSTSSGGSSDGVPGGDGGATTTAGTTSTSLDTSGSQGSAGVTTDGTASGTDASTVDTESSEGAGATSGCSCRSDAPVSSPLASLWALAVLGAVRRRGGVMRAPRA